MALGNLTFFWIKFKHSIMDRGILLAIVIPVVTIGLNSTKTFIHTKAPTIVLPQWLQCAFGKKT